MLRKILVLEIIKTQTKKIYMASKYNFNLQFGVFLEQFH